MGAKRLFPALACALALLSAPAAPAATGDLRVSVGSLKIPRAIRLGRSATFAIGYTVRGPARRRAVAKVELKLDDTRNIYRIVSNPTTVRAAVWSWKVTDQLPKSLDPGRYAVTATVTLRRGGKVVSRAHRRKMITISST